jgi:Winged helix-turn helix
MHVRWHASSSRRRRFPFQTSRLVQAARDSTGAVVVPCRMVPTVSRQSHGGELGKLSMVGRCWHAGMMSWRTTTERTPCGPPTIPIALTAEQRQQVEAVLRRGKVEKRVYLRGRALLMMADGVPANRIAWQLRVHERTTERWRQRFQQGDPLQMLADAHRSGRPRSLSRTPTALA